MVNLSELLHRRSRMRPAATRITTLDGQQLYEEKQPDGSVVVKKVGSSMWGFVVDEKPDLNVAEITDHLFVGSQDVANDLSVLRLYEISHLLNVAGPACSVFYDGFQYREVALLDLPTFDIRSFLDECFDFIQSATSSGKRVLCYCNAGVSRSVTVAAAFLLKFNNMNLSSALTLIRNKRSCAKPNDGFMRQLIMFESELIKAVDK